MTRADIITKVKSRIDELSPFSVEELNPEIDLIDKLLDESTTTVLLFLPLYLLTPSTFPTTLTQTGRTGHIDLPSDFLKLYSFKMDGWATEVTDAISTQHPKYQLQKYEVTMGGVNKPVVVIKNNKVLYYYSLPAGATHTVTEALYIKNLVPDADPATIPDDLTDFIAWQCASDVFLAMGEQQASNAAKQKMVDLVTLKSI